MIATSDFHGVPPTPLTRATTGTVTTSGSGGEVGVGVRVGVFVLVLVRVAVGVLVGELTLLDAHDIQTQRIIEEKEKKTEIDMAVMEDDYRKIMKELGFNLLILPIGQRLDNLVGKLLLHGLR